MNNGIVLHKLKMVYWYIPKVACTTLKIHFANLCGLPYNKSDPMSVHKYCWEEWEKVSEPIPEYFNFAYVRDPFTRLRSLYCDKIVSNYSTLIWDKYRDDFYHNMPFEKFIDSIKKHLSEADIHFEKQVNLIPKDVECFDMEGRDFLMMSLSKLNQTSRCIKVNYEIISHVKNLYDEDNTLHLSLWEP